MNKQIRLTAGLLALLLTLGVFTANAQEQPSKDEVIYVNLNHDGSTRSVYVVNAFEIPAAGSYTDYGPYTALRNLTTTQPLEAVNGGVTFQAEKGRFYYQGELPAVELPWNIRVGYSLDGRELTGAMLAGATGRVKITLDITKNFLAAPAYAANFALQISVNLDSRRCKNLDAPNATLANVGSDRQLSYMVLPGKEGHFTISADVDDFEMTGIQLAGVPLRLALDKPDTAEIKTLLAELQDGVAQLDDGAATLGDGSLTLYEGVAELRDGTADLQEGAYSLFTGTRDYNKGVQQAAQGGQQLASAVAGSGLVQGGTQLAQQLQATIDSLDMLVGYGQVDAAVAGQLKSLLGASRDYAAGSSQLLSAVGGVANGLGQLAMGGDDLQNGVRELYEGTIDLNDGVGRLYEGVAELRDGVDELTTGTAEFREQSGGMDGKVDEQIDTLINQYSGDSEAVASFTDRRNTGLANMQFVMRLDDIKKAEAAPVPQPEQTAPTLWQRIAALFVF